MEGVFQQSKASLEERGSFSVLKKETLSDCALFKSLEEQYKDNYQSFQLENPFGSLMMLVAIPNDHFER